MKDKKVLLGIGTGVAVVLIIVGWLTGLTGKKEKEVAIAKPTIAPIAAVLFEKDRPEIEISINSDRSGGTINISNIANQFAELEYELIYTAESDGLSVERGVAGGPITIDSSRKVSETVLFGTESCTTGICKRHIDKNVSEGILVIRLIDNEGKAWGHETSFTIEKTTKGYEAILE